MLPGEIDGKRFLRAMRATPDLPPINAYLLASSGPTGTLRSAGTPKECAYALTTLVLAERL